MSIRYDRQALSATPVLTLNTYIWVCWVLYRNNRVELWIDGVKRASRVATAAEPMKTIPDPYFVAVEINGKAAPVGGQHVWDSQFCQDNYGPHNADSPLILNSAGLRVAYPLVAGAADCTNTNPYDDITLGVSPQEYLRAVRMFVPPALGDLAYFLGCDSGVRTTLHSNLAAQYPFWVSWVQNGRWDAGEAKWGTDDTYFNGLGWGSENQVGAGTGTQLYGLMATIDEGTYQGAYPLPLYRYPDTRIRM